MKSFKYIGVINLTELNKGGSKMSIRLDSEKKTVLTVLALMVGILLIAGNLYADGDLIVTGKLGVGTDQLPG